jgi:hypothetical protein
MRYSCQSKPDHSKTNKIHSFVCASSMCNSNQHDFSCLTHLVLWLSTGQETQGRGRLQDLAKRRIDAGLRCDVLVGFKDRRARARNYRTWARARKSNAGSRTRSGEGDEDSPGNAGRAWASGEGDEEYAGLARASDEGEAGRRTRSGEGEGEGDSSWTTQDGCFVSLPVTVIFAT